MNKRKLMTQTGADGLARLYTYSVKLLPLLAHEHGARATVETVDDVQYLVIPTVAVLETVLNGMLLPAEEITKFPETWEGAPVPIGHPKVNDWYVSARTKDQLHKCAGWFFDVNSVGDRAKLIGDIWIDIDRAYKLGANVERAVSQLRNGHGAEVSTAFFADIEPVSGSYNGVEYWGVFRNIVPDHLAILLDQEGACNWEDGCGCPRANASGPGEGEPGDQAALENGDNEAPSASEGDSLLNIEQENNQSQERSIDMDRQAMIEALIACQCCELTAEQLAELSDETLTVMHSMTVNFATVLAANEQQSQGEPGEQAPAAAPVTTPDPVVNAAEQDSIMQDVVDSFGGVEQFKSALIRVKANADTERQALVSTVLAANAGFEQGELDTMPVDTLRKLAASLSEQGESDFSGLALPKTHSQGAKELPMPEINWSA